MICKQWLWMVVDACRTTLHHAFYVTCLQLFCSELLVEGFKGNSTHTSRKCHFCGNALHLKASKSSSTELSVKMRCSPLITIFTIGVRSVMNLR